MPQISSNIALVKNATLHGVFWGSYMQHRPRVLRQSLEQLLAWLGEGRISIPIFHRRVPLTLSYTFLSSKRYASSCSPGCLAAGQRAALHPHLSQARFVNLPNSVLARQCRPHACGELCTVGTKILHVSRSRSRPPRMTRTGHGAPSEPPP